MTSLLVLLLVLLSSLTGPVVSQDEDQEDGDAEVAPTEATEEAAEEDAVAEEGAVAEEDAVAVDEGDLAGAPPEDLSADAEAEEPSDTGDTTVSPSAEPDGVTAAPDSSLPTAIDGDVTGFGLDGSGSGSGEGPTEQPAEMSPVIILIPVVLVVVIIAMVVGGIVCNRRWNRNKSYSTDNEKGDPYLDDNTEKVPMPMFEEDVPSVLELEMEELDQWMNKDGGTTVDSKHIEL